MDGPVGNVNVGDDEDIVGNCISSLLARGGLVTIPELSVGGDVTSPTGAKSVGETVGYSIKVTSTPDDDGLRFASPLDFDA